MYFGHTRLPRVPDTAPPSQSLASVNMFSYLDTFLPLVQMVISYPSLRNYLRWDYLLQSYELVRWSLPHVSSWHKDQESTKFPSPPSFAGRNGIFIPTSLSQSLAQGFSTSTQLMVPGWSYVENHSACVSVHSIRGTFPWGQQDGLMEEMDYGKIAHYGVAFIGAWRTYCPGHMYIFSSDVGKLLAMHFMGGGLYNTLFTVLR